MMVYCLMGGVRVQLRRNKLTAFLLFFLVKLNLQNAKMAFPFFWVDVQTQL